MTGTAVPSRKTPSTSTSGLPIMKSTWTPEWLTPRSSRSSHVRSRPRRDRVGQPFAVGDVRGRVLVEERVEKRDAGAADTRVVVDERDLPEPPGVLVGGHALAQHVLALGGAHLDGAPALEAHLDVADEAAEQHEWLRRAHDAVHASRVRRGEDLLGRHVRDVREAPRRLRVGAVPDRALGQPDPQVGARAAQVHGVEAVRGERRRRASAGGRRGHARRPADRARRAGPRPRSRARAGRRPAPRRRARPTRAVGPATITQLNSPSLSCSR